MKTIVLCGLPGCGKTTVGMLLAKMNSGIFIDIDLLIEKKYLEIAGETLSCRQIFAQKGGQFFREFEKEIIASLALKSNENAIISIGGGAVEATENIQNLKSIGLLIYLKVGLEELFKRINRKGLPAYLDPNAPFSSFEKLADKRYPFYKNAADFEVDAEGLTPEEIAKKIIEKVS